MWQLDAGLSALKNANNCCNNAIRQRCHCLSKRIKERERERESFYKVQLGSESISALPSK